MKAILIACALMVSDTVLAECSPADIEIASVKARFVDECRQSSCVSMKGVAVMINHCDAPIGVQVQITAYDKFGAPVATRELWPASVRNIPPGNYTFSLDQYIDYDPSIATFDLKPVAVKKWK